MFETVIYHGIDNVDRLAFVIVERSGGVHDLAVLCPEQAYVRAGDTGLEAPLLVFSFVPPGPSCGVPVNNTWRTRETT